MTAYLTPALRSGIALWQNPYSAGFMLVCICVFVVFIIVETFRKTK